MGRNRRAGGRGPGRPRLPAAEKPVPGAQLWDSGHLGAKLGREEGSPRVRKSEWGGG